MGLGSKTGFERQTKVEIVLPGIAGSSEDQMTYRRWLVVLIAWGDPCNLPLPSINGASCSFICCWRRSIERLRELELQS